MKKLFSLLTFIVLMFVQTLKAGDGTVLNPFELTQYNTVVSNIIFTPADKEKSYFKTNCNVYFVAKTNGFITVQTTSTTSAGDIGFFKAHELDNNKYSNLWTNKNLIQTFRVYAGQTYVVYYVGQVNKITETNNLIIKYVNEIPKKITSVTFFDINHVRYYANVDSVKKELKFNIPTDCDITKIYTIIDKLGNEYTYITTNGKLYVDRFINDFSKISTLVINDSNSMTLSYTVKFHRPNDAFIESYKIQGQLSSDVNLLTKTVNVVMPKNTNLEKLISTFSLSDKSILSINNVNQNSGISINNFTKTIIAKVLAEDGKTTQDWTINVNIIKNIETKILTYNIPNGITTYDFDNKKINVIMPTGASLKKLVANYTLSTGATAKVNSNIQINNVTVNDFTKPVIYTVTAEDGVTIQNWIVNVSVAKNIEADLSDFNIVGQKSSYVDSKSKLVTVVMPTGTDISNLVSNFIISTGATLSIDNILQESGYTENDYSKSKIVVVTSQDGLTKIAWTIKITIDINTDLESNLSDNVNVYPNPSTGLYHINLTNMSIVKLTIFNTTGVIVWTKNVNNEQLVDVDLTTNRTGLYFLKIETGDSSTTVKLVKK